MAKGQTGDRYEDKGRSTTGAARVPRAASGVDSVAVASLQDAAGRRCLEALHRLAAHDEGWLRIVSHDHGNLVYLKYKFSRGKYAGGYVMYRMGDSDFALALEALMQKVTAVYDGVLRPTPDHPYD